MPININGYNITDNNGLTFGGTSSRVDTSGRLFLANIPVVFGSKVGIGVQREYPWRLNSQVINVNGAYSTSSWLFTCPVAGLYYTSWSGICLGSNSTTATNTKAGYIGVVKNGGLQTFSHWNTNDYWDTQCLETILPCAAGDTIGWAAHISPAPYNGITDAGAYGDNHNMATIWLIG